MVFNQQMYNKLEIIGFRGFAKKATLNLALPNGKEGSGLSIIVGANNSGKSTIIEALQAFAIDKPISITQGRRNLRAGDNIEITLTGAGNSIDRTIKSTKPGSSETETSARSNHDIFVLTSRRSFNPFFSFGGMERQAYTSYVGFPSHRVTSISEFTNRLFIAQKNLHKFNEVLARVLDEVPDWSIDQYDTGQYFVRINIDTGHHSSEGLGEGLVSLFFIVDALYDSKPGETIAIDEPELSLHPAFQRKLMKLFAEYSKDRQVIISTHSPYFIDFNSILNGGTIARAHVDENGSLIFQLQDKTINQLSKLLENRNNPHILGLNAQEVFFLQDGVVLVEGQEDIIYIQRALSSLNNTLDGNFFGWGVGGAGNMETIVQLLQDLGFKKVVGILDKNEVTHADKLRSMYPDYHFQTIPANDIRTKPKVAAKEAVKGLLDESNKTVRSEYVEAMNALIQSTNDYLSN